MTNPSSQSRLAIGAVRTFHFADGYTANVRRLADDCYEVTVYDGTGKESTLWRRVWDGELSDLPIGQSGRATAWQYVCSIAFDRGGFVPEPTEQPAQPELFPDVDRDLDLITINAMSEPAKRALRASQGHYVLRSDVPLGVLQSLAYTYTLGEVIRSNDVNRPFAVTKVALSSRGKRVRSLLREIEGNES